MLQKTNVYKLHTKLQNRKEDDFMVTYEVIGDNKISVYSGNNNSENITISILRKALNYALEEQQLKSILIETKKSYSKI